MKITLLSITPDAEKLIESVGRTSYQSFDRMKEGSEKDFIRMIVKNGHHAVLEFGFAVFRVAGVSRNLTHQLVRHRLCSFIQRSQRYVNEEDFQFVEPESIRNNVLAHITFMDEIKACREVYKTLQGLGIKKEDCRFIIPGACTTEIVIGANFREYRHMIELRTSLKAQWEIRELFQNIWGILMQFAPTVFEDLDLEGMGE